MVMALGMTKDVDFVEAYDGQQALDAVTKYGDKNPYTMVIMDLTMPVMDGYDSSRAIIDWCTEKKCKNIPTIYAVTASDHTPVLEKKIKSYGLYSI